MTTNAAPLGLLLDVDGPIASPVSRTIAVDSIVGDLVRLAEAGVPIVFNTGRSDAFIREQVYRPLLDVGLASGARVHAVCEKGAVWLSLQEVDGDVHEDQSLVLPGGLRDEVRALVADRYAQTMFVDETKRAMISVEQNVEAAPEDYRAAQRAFDADVLDLAGRRGLGVEGGGDRRPDDAGEVAYRVDPNIIATDIESIRTGKALGAERAVRLLQADGALPRAWRTMGDSRSDYAMADWLHGRGHEVTHVDVRPADGLLTKAYPVLSSGSIVHDEAGAVFLNRWVAMLAP